MRFFEFALHLLTPRHSNNHKAKALHFSAIAFYITFLLIFQITLSATTGLFPGVLGYASNITVDNLLRETNSRRATVGSLPLVLNDQLSEAAAAKAADMFADQYWAHNSPQGKNPWSFISSAGYNFLFAGENLARDFGDSKGVVDAWMNSPSHRDNLLNNRYREVGFAVVNGKYGSSETTLVVQMFGTRSSSAPTVVAPGTATNPSPAPIQEENPVNTSPSGMILNTNNSIPPVSGQKLQGLFQINPLGLTKSLSTGLILFLMAVLLVDGFLVYKRKIVRLSGHNFAHLLIFMALLVALNLIGRGAII